MRYIIGIGSNLGDKKDNLKMALNELNKEKKIKVLKKSFLYESPALVPKDKLLSSEWCKPYLNMAVLLEFNESPLSLLYILKNIETIIGRDLEKEKWSSRLIDLDILCAGENNFFFSKENLEIPHREVLNRSFTLAPLRDLVPNNIISLKSTPLNYNRSINKPLPIWMGIINLTPDSFSNLKRINAQSDFFLKLKSYTENNIQIIDLGAESTRPGANEVLADEEWRRLSSFIDCYSDFIKGASFYPKLSIDTRNYETALKALDKGAHIINDVSGLADLRMLDLIKSYNADYVLMHSLSIPAQKNINISLNINPTVCLLNWCKSKIDFLKENGVDLDKIYFDPGIGFGKTALQSIEILKNINDLKKLNIKLLVGHSRKSFISHFSKSLSHQRDFESVGISLKLASNGVDVIRVHDPENHSKAYKGFLNVS